MTFVENTECSYVFFFTHECSIDAAEHNGGLRSVGGFIPLLLGYTIFKHNACISVMLIDVCNLTNIVI